MSRFSRVIQLLPSDRQQQALSAERQLQAPLPVARRVAFAALSGGTGCTTAARRVASTIGSRRSARVLWVDSTDAERGDRWEGSAHVDALAVPAPVWPGGIERWRTQCESAQRAHDLTVTDWGVLDLPDLVTVAAHSHVTCVTTTTELLAVRRAVDAAAFLIESGSCTLVVASAVRTRMSPATRRMLASSPAPLMPLPHDYRARAVGSPVSGGSSFALTRLGARIMQACQPTPREAGAA